MTTISLHEAKAHLSSLVAAVERTGEPVIIERHGRAVAELVPIPRGSRLGKHAQLSNVMVKGDLLESTEKEWGDV